MRLINTRKLIEDRIIHFEEFYDNDIPEYAILSHTWEHNQEVTYQNCNTEESKGKSGYFKIRNTCELALNVGIRYVWVDTCCIDKSSSAELTEAINSMFKWYQRAKHCYAYLADLESVEELRNCRWFTRGWTLQELIAPTSMWFFDRNWHNVGSKKELCCEISSITRIPIDVLHHITSLSSICVARRFSWAARRVTTRTEDMAYCLLGIFDINIPMIYGEGSKAFYRLQEEIVKSTYDLSILAWTPLASRDSDCYGVLAESVKDFEGCSEMYSLVDVVSEGGEMTVTSKGLRLQALQWLLSANGKLQYMLELTCTVPDKPEVPLTIAMRKVGPNIYFRTRTHDHLNVFAPSHSALLQSDNQLVTYTLLTKIPEIPLSRSLGLSDGEKLVAHSRFTMIEIKMPSLLSHGHATPRQYWDAQDYAFFGSRSSLRNSGMLFLSRKCNFGLACLWFKKDGQWTLHASLASSGNTVAEAGEWRALKTELINSGQQYAPGIYNSDNIPDMGPVQHLVEVEVDGKKVKVSFQTRRSDNAKLCSGPRWIVQMTAREAKS